MSQLRHPPHTRQQWPENTQKLDKIGIWLFDSGTLPIRRALFEGSQHIKKQLWKNLVGRCA